MYVPQLSEDSFQEFQRLRLEDCGGTISDAEVRASAKNFMDIYVAVLNSKLEDSNGQ